uniref:Organelle RRM domain-containing protein 6, chloroplastic-like n=1 Tax=Tanacetum cinerariifolium TaxID=118510 RepID=A0A6L2L0R8_TANCI|nr:organelle RRM domain-containing protein 6, chloroplastic-like [Tanacetum cinerariifolium]
MNCIEEIAKDAKVIEIHNQLLVLIKRQTETEMMLEEKFIDLCKEGELYMMTRLQMMVDESHVSVRGKHTFREINADLQFAVGLSRLWDVLYNRVNEIRMLSSELNLFGGPLAVQCAEYLKQLSKNDNGAMDMNDTMDNLEERTTNLEMMFAYLKNKKMLERHENKPKKETPSSHGTTNEDIAEFEVASKSTSSTSKPKNVTAHKVVTQKVQTKAFPVRSPVPIKNCILGLAAAHTWACTCNKIFGTRKQKDAIVAGQAKKEKRKDLTVNMIKILWDPKGRFLIEKDSRLNSKKSTMDHSFGSAEEVDHVRILQSCNSLLLCSVTVYLDWPLILENQVTKKWCKLEAKLFTIYEMMKGSSVWSVRYLVNIVQLLNPLPEGWSIRTGVWSICLGEREDDAFVEINLSGKVVKYNLISKTNTEIFDIGSNQMDDDDGDGDDAVLFIPPCEVDHNLYEFISFLQVLNLVMDKIANRPRGFAFLRYATKEESDKAIEGMHGKVSR